MAEGAELMGQRKGVQDEGVGSGSRGEDQTQSDDRRALGWFLGPPPEVRVPAAPMRSNPVIRKRSEPAVNSVEGHCHGSDCGGNENESPRLNENVDGNSTLLSVVPNKGVSAMADCVSPDAETIEI